MLAKHPTLAVAESEIKYTEATVASEKAQRFLHRVSGQTGFNNPRHHSSLWRNCERCLSGTGGKDRSPKPKPHAGRPLPSRRAAE